MLQKMIFESQNCTPKETNSQSQNPLIQNSFIFSKKILYEKYSKFEYSYSLFSTNNLVFNEKCRIVARFKDYLILDDSTEFLRRFYSKKELTSRLKKIYNFYESYCKIFPNYMILPESQFLYRNIRKKQKMIDAFNEIKKEEEENRKHLKLGLSGDKNKNNNVVFTKKIQESIERYYPSLSNILCNTFMSDMNNNEIEKNNNDKSIITLSLSNQKMNINEILPNNIKDVKAFDKYLTPNSCSFDEHNFNDNNNSQISLFKIVQILDNNNIKDKNMLSNNNTNEKIIKQNKKEIKINSNNNNSKNNNKISIKKVLNNNTIQRNSNINTINTLNKHTRVKTNLNDSHNKKKKQEVNLNPKTKFISHKQNISVPLASNMLHNNDNHINNINNIIEGENNTIKIINNINNIIINDDKTKTINNGMIININNNYFQLKESKQTKNNILKRLKSKEGQSKEKTNKTKDKNKEIDFHKFQMFRDKRTYTTYNTQNNLKKTKKFLVNEIQSPNNKTSKLQNTDMKKKKINSKKYLLTINDLKQDNIFRNTNYHIDKKISKKLIESKTITATNPKEEKIKNKPKNANNNHIIAITEANTTIATSYNPNKLSNKITAKNKNIKNIPQLEGVESVDRKRISINRKEVNNYFTSNQKKKTHQGKFHVHENTDINALVSKQYTEGNNTEKIDFINICNTIENNSNPIKFKLNKKNLMKKKAKTNSVHINNKNEFLSSFNIPKDKITGNNFELGMVNIEEKMAKYQKSSFKKLLNNKTQTNSEAELIKDLNQNRNIFNTIQSKSREKILKKIKQNNDFSDVNNKTNVEKPESTKEIKKINVKEMKEKYHNLLRGNKFNHGSYDIANRLHLFKKIKGINNIKGNLTSSINSIINNNKRSPLMKKNVLSPNEKLQTSMNNYIKTPMKKRFETNKDIKDVITIEVNNLGNRFKLIGKKNKQTDSNNKKMKFLKNKS